MPDTFRFGVGFLIMPFALLLAWREQTDLLACRLDQALVDIGLGGDKDTEYSERGSGTT